MERRKFLCVVGGSACLAAQAGITRALFGRGEVSAMSGDVLGMYVHEGLSYKHPYAARTWTFEDWQNYADGITKLGYNTMMIWPSLEGMPSPLTPSDRAALQKIANVIGVLHRDFGMKVWIVLCPNIVANSAKAAEFSYEERPYSCPSTFIDPSDLVAIGQMIKWREELLRPLAEMDSLAIIDSDPGGYPGSTNAQFVSLLGEHRRMLDRLRSGIELYYWMHAGWETYSQYYQTGKFEPRPREETIDVLTRLNRLNPEPWGITVHAVYDWYAPPDSTKLDVARRLGLDSRAVAFNFGAIEGDPAYPITNFGSDTAFQAGQAKAPRGVVGNADTHCVQLPNTFAFARGAKGQPVTEADYVDFADELITGQGQLIVEGGKDPPRRLGRHRSSALTSASGRGR